MRTPKLAIAAGGAGVAAVAILVLRRRGRMTPPIPRDERGRWRVVTIARPAEDLAELPAPLADLGDAVEVQLSPAPGGRGTDCLLYTSDAADE